MTSEMEPTTNNWCDGQLVKVLLKLAEKGEEGYATSSFRGIVRK
jgi:hypothetical protein